MDAFYSLEEQEKIILENQKLVYYLVKKFNVVPDNYEDFVSVGTIGLIKAVATFDASKDISEHVVQLSVANNWQLAEIQLERLSLDAIFAQLSGKKVQ